MQLIDTHTHLYLEEFDSDRNNVIERAIKQGVRGMILPNIDSTTVKPLLSLYKQFPGNCFPMAGLHPTSVNKAFDKEFNSVEQELKRGIYYGIGEIGIDLYWDTTFRDEQEEVFKRQLQLAKKHKLPVSIHTRNSFDIVINIVKRELTGDLRGVFHCFSGNTEEAKEIMDTGFKMGIGGILTFKNSGLDKVVKGIPLNHLVLETDSPYLTPVPFRGKRNESSYLTYIAGKLAEIKDVTAEEIAEKTTNNASELFNIIIK